MSAQPYRNVRSLESQRAREKERRAKETQRVSVSRRKQETNLTAIGRRRNLIKEKMGNKVGKLAPDGFFLFLKNKKIKK